MHRSHAGRVARSPAARCRKIRPADRQYVAARGRPHRERPLRADALQRAAEICVDGPTRGRGAPPALGVDRDARRCPGARRARAPCRPSASEAGDAARAPWWSSTPCAAEQTSDGQGRVPGKGGAALEPGIPRGRAGGEQVLAIDEGHAAPSSACSARRRRPARGRWARRLDRRVLCEGGPGTARSPGRAPRALRRQRSRAGEAAREGRPSRATQERDRAAPSRMRFEEDVGRRELAVFRARGSISRRRLREGRPCVPGLAQMQHARLHAPMDAPSRPRVSPPPDLDSLVPLEEIARVVEDHGEPRRRRCRTAGEARPDLRGARAAHRAGGGARRALPGGTTRARIAPIKFFDEARRTTSSGRRATRSGRAARLPGSRRRARSISASLIAKRIERAAAGRRAGP